MVATHHLIPIADHRPAALQMQGNALAIKAGGIQVMSGLSGDEAGQIQKTRLTMELPHAVDVAGPGTTVGRVPRGCTTKDQ